MEEIQLLVEDIRECILGDCTKCRYNSVSEDLGCIDRMLEDVLKVIDKE